MTVTINANVSGMSRTDQPNIVIELCYRLSGVIVLCCYLCCSVIIVLFYVLIVCTVTLPPGVNPIAVDNISKKVCIAIDCFFFL